MNKRIAVLVGVLIVGAVVAVIALRGYPPTGNTSGAIGAAQRYQSQPMTDSDVQLSAADVQAFLQSDLFHKIATNPSFRQEVKNGDIGKLYGTPAFAKLVGEDSKFMDLLARTDFQQAITNQHVEALVRDPDMARLMLNPNFRRMLDDAGFLNLFGNRYLAIGRTSRVGTANARNLDSGKGAVEASKSVAEASRGTVEASKGTVEASKGTVEASKGTVEASKATVEASRGVVESGSFRMEDLQIDASKIKDSAKLQQAREELSRLKDNSQFQALAMSDGFAQLITNKDAAAIVTDSHVVNMLRSDDLARVAATEESRTDLQAVFASDAVRSVIANGHFTEMLQVAELKGFLASNGFRDVASHYSADLSQAIEGMKTTE